MNWHLEVDVVERYQRREVDRVVAASVERHLEACADCRRMIVADPQRMSRNWERVAATVDSVNRNPIERGLSWLGLSQHTARLITLTPSLRTPWLVAVALVMVSGAVVSGQGVGNFLLVLTPYMAVLGVGLAYGQMGDPAYESTVSSPYDPVRLLLLRTVAVTSVTFSVALIAEAISGARHGFGLWFLPALALTVLTLALGTRLQMWVAAVTVSVLWTLALTTVSLRSTLPVQESLQNLASPAARSVFVVLLILAATVSAIRRDSYRRAVL